MLSETNLDKKSDQELYLAFLKSNNEAFNTLVKKYRKSLIAFIIKYVKNIEIAEDLAQDTFVYMLINKKEYDFKYTFKTYLYTIAKSRAINYLKKEKRKIIFDESYMLDNDIEFYEENLDATLIKKENYEILYKNLKRLKQDYKLAIYLADFQGFKYKEISRILNKTLPQTKMLIHRARKALEKSLKKEENLC